MKFNINDIVKVRLTPSGRAFHAAKFAIFKAKTKINMTYRAPAEDAEGWSEWQLWRLMGEFGAELYNGNSHPPFSIEIEITAPTPE